MAFSLVGPTCGAIEEACEKHETSFWSYSADGIRVRTAAILKRPSSSAASAVASIVISSSPTVKVTEDGSGYTLKILQLATSASSTAKTVPLISTRSRPSSWVSIASNSTALAST